MAGGHACRLREGSLTQLLAAAFTYLADTAPSCRRPTFDPTPHLYMERETTSWGANTSCGSQAPLKCPLQPAPHSANSSSVRPLSQCRITDGNGALHAQRPQQIEDSTRECGNSLTIDLAYIAIWQRGYMKMDIATDLAPARLISDEMDLPELVIPDGQLMYHSR
jgi:hypothetical protein